jgi:protein-tyrosine-phosphatase
MAEGLLKQHIGNRVYVQSAGVASDRDIDGFSISVCSEIGIELTKHTVRSFQELEEWGEDLDGYDLIIALSATSERVACEHTADAAVDVEYWDIVDPTATGETRAEKLDAYRGVRDDILARIKDRFQF